MSQSEKAMSTLQAVFGFDRFREGQEQAIHHLLAGQSVLAIFPTGAGKSLCYQLPALLLDGLTLVISPLIALMKDQIDFLLAHNVPAARLDSSQPFEESRQVLSDLHSGKLKLLYVAPERLANERFLQTLKRLPLAMMAVDEAHCISEWGHNFRPEYMKLAGLARQLRVGRVLALTATATPAVARDIAASFGVADECIVQTGFYRPNLALHAAPCPLEQRPALLAERLRSRPRGPTIVYVTLQRTAEEIASFLCSQRFAAKAYHAGMDAELRHTVQDWFMASSEAVVVATIAFGMGIDKRDIRYVYHYNLPKSLENYAQEIGRAGRDGQPSTCELFGASEDLITLENFTYGDTPTPDAIASLIQDVLSRGEVFDISTYDLAFEHDIRPLVVETVLTYLELDQLIESTGHFYSEYKFQPRKSSAEILARFDPDRAAFLRSVFSRARKGKTWFALAVDEVAEALGQPRGRIIAALNYLEEQGDLIVEAAGVRQSYRRKQTPANPAQLRQRMVDRFIEREKRDIARLGQVLQFAALSTCRTRYLLDYFGENRPADCGHCGPCHGGPSVPMPPAPTRPLGEKEAGWINELGAQPHEALASPRQLARFFCGLSSPKMSRAKLIRHPLFSALDQVPFQQVLRFVEKAQRS